MDAQSQWTGLDAGRLERITDHIERNYIRPGKIAGCQVAVARHGHSAYFKSFGQMDLERAKPMADDAIFRIYSMTKPITSVALMTLYERGYFQLNDPVSRFVPSWKNHRVWVSGEGADMVTEAPHRPVSFRDVLTHMSGLTYGGGLPGVGIQHPIDQIYRDLKVRSVGGRDTMMEFLDKLGQVPLRYQPGEQWMYSLATDVCGALVEVISGRPLADYLREEIFEPLGMKDTAFFVPPEKTDRFCANYQRMPDKSLKLIDDPKDGMALEPDDYGVLTRIVIDTLHRPIALVLEGGYGPSQGEAVRAIFLALLGEPVRLPGGTPHPSTQRVVRALRLLSG